MINVNLLIERDGERERERERDIYIEREREYSIHTSIYKCILNHAKRTTSIFEYINVIYI